MNKLMFVFFVLLITSGCSNRALYDNLQSQQHQKCIQDSTVHIKDCESIKEQSYDEYKRQREEQLGKDN